MEFQLLAITFSLLDITQTNNEMRATFGLEVRKVAEWYIYIPHEGFRNLRGCYPRGNK